MSNTLADYNLALVLLSYLVSVLGALTGLFAASFIRGPQRAGGMRIGWLLLASLLIGGCAIWAMHFLGMIAYNPGGPMAYDIPMTLASLIVPVVFVLFGLYVAFGWPERPMARTLAGMITGLGVAAMHYTGMAAIRIGADLSYDPTIVAVSILIAIVAAIAALHIAVTLTGWPRYLSSLVMGIAVCGMHYTGMAALRITPVEVDVDYFNNAFTEQIAGFAVVTIVIAACAIGAVLAGSKQLSETDTTVSRDSY